MYEVDEFKDFYKEDLRSKNSVSRSYSNDRSRRGGKVRLPQDYLTKDELNALNGEVKTYNIGKPLTWREFDNFPDGIKEAYIERLRERYSAPNNAIADMFCVDTDYFIEYLKSKGIPVGYSRYYELNKEAWASFISSKNVS